MADPAAIAAAALAAALVQRQNEWQAVLTNVVGLGQQAVEEIAEQGLAVIADLIPMTEKDIQEIRSTVLKHPSPNRPAGANVIFPYSALKTIQAIKEWIKTRQNTGMTWAAVSCTQEEIDATKQRIMEMEVLKAATEDLEVPKPEKLANFKKWILWAEQWDTYMQGSRGAADIPLNYVYRQHMVVTPEMRNGVYASNDQKLYFTTILSGRHFEIDNARVWTELKSLCIDGPAWDFIKQYEATKNGRLAFLKLVRENSSTSNVTIRKQMAYKSIASLAYSGPRRNWVFANYVAGHQHGHNELFDCGDPMSEARKVTDFLEGIDDPTLDNAKDVIYGDDAKMNSFELCHQYLATVAASKKVAARGGRKRGRDIGAVEREKNPKKGRGKGGGGKFKGNGNKNTNGPPGNITLSGTKKYTGKEWFQVLNDEQRDKVNALREAERNKDGKARKASGIASEKEDEVMEETEDDTKQAGTQFGRAVHKKGKKQ